MKDLGLHVGKGFTWSIHVERTKKVKTFDLSERNVSLKVGTV